MPDSYLPANGVSLVSFQCKKCDFNLERLNKFTHFGVEAKIMKMGASLKSGDYYWPEPEAITCR